jgi:hypothetical protein
MVVEKDLISCTKPYNLDTSKLTKLTNCRAAIRASFAAWGLARAFNDYMHNPRKPMSASCIPVMVRMQPIIIKTAHGQNHGSFREQESPDKYKIQ